MTVHAGQPPGLASGSILGLIVRRNPYRYPIKPIS